MTRKRPLVALALVLAFSLAWAGAKQAAPQAVPTIRVTTRLVQVSVVAHDKKGEPVADLTKDDFVLLDEGKQQKVAVFAVESNQPSRRVLTPLPRNTYSNELERQPGAVTSLTVILFDTLNTPTKDQPYAREQVVKFLDQLQPQEVARASRAVNDANLAIYPVDARGLVGLADIAPSYNAATAPGKAATLATMDRRVQARFNATLDGMNELAERTGGRAFYNSNDVMGSIRQAVDDSRVTYVLGVYPKEADWNAKFHRLKVQVKRPGVQIRYRQGFYAIPDRATTEAQRNQLVNVAARSPLEATQLALTLRLSPPPSPADPLRFEIILNPGQLTFERREGRMAASLTVLFLQKTVDGKELKAKGQTFQTKMSEAEYQKMLAQGMAIPAEWQIEPGAEQLRVVVCDDASALLGSITVPLGNRR